MEVNVKERSLSIASPRFSLKAKAVLAWERERPTREAARIEKQAQEIKAVRDKIVGMFGSDYEVKLGIDHTGHITATVEGIRFITHVYSYGVITVSIFLVERCPSCGEDVTIGQVSDLADLGELISNPDSARKHICQQSHS